MAKSSGLGQRLFVAGYDIGGDAGSIRECSSPRGVYVVTGIDKTAVERIMGRSDGRFSFDTFFNDASAQEHAALKGLPTSNVVLNWAMAATIGATAMGLTAKQINYDFARPIDGSLLLSVDALAANGVPLEWGVLLTAGKRSDTTATNGASLDNSAASSNGAAAYLHVFSFTGTSVTVAIQDSPDNSAWTTRMTFTAASGVTSERITWSGSPARYLRVITTGTFSEASFAVMLRRGTAQDDAAYS